MNWGADNRAIPYVYGLIHAAVDATTVSVFFAAMAVHQVTPGRVYGLVIAYNLLAFAGQALWGYLTDKFQIPRGATAAGIGLAALAVVALPVNPVLVVILAGTGNAMFHVGGGTVCLWVEKGRSAPPGIFVAPGSLGLAIGLWMGRAETFLLWPLLVAMGVCLAVVVLYRIPKVRAYREPAIRPSVAYLPLIVGVLLFTVAVRSFVGLSSVYELPKLPIISMGLVTAALLGKGLGGVLSDRFGWIPISVGALLVSAPMVAFGSGEPWVLLVGLCIFQLTMPVTLAALAALLPGRPGLSFGAACVAYVLGVLLTFGSAIKSYYVSWNFLILILLTSAALYWALSAMRRADVPMVFDSKPVDQNQGHPEARGISHESGQIG